VLGAIWPWVWSVAGVALSDEVCAYTKLTAPRMVAAVMADVRVLEAFIVDLLQALGRWTVGFDPGPWVAKGRLDTS
jgi:hypothetical protein